MADNVFMLVSCIFFMLLVAFISYLKTRNRISNSDGYFLAGRSLTGGFIAGSLLLTNLSAEQLIGLNGQAYGANMSNMAWEVTAAFSVIILALLLLPRYLSGAFSTLPEFLGERFDQGVRRYVVVLFMLGYVFVTIPSVLYSGALAVLQLFNIPDLFGITYEQSVWAMVWTVGLIGAAYAVFGGLRAVAVSDTLNGIGLLIVGLIVPILGFIELGGGNLLQGMEMIAVNEPEKLNAVGSSEDAVPIGTVFSGMIMMNLFYWATNQYVIQRTLGAKNLAEGQKGVLFSGFYKMLVPLFMMVPGVIAYHLYGDGLRSIDLAYPELINNLLPGFLGGFFLAVLMGAVLSSFNSLLNSASTMFALDVYKANARKEISDRHLITVSKWFGSVLALISFFIAPMLMFAPEGLWTIIREFTGFFNIPIITIVLFGVFTNRVPPLAAKIVIIFHVVSYYIALWGLPQFAGVEIPVNFIYVSFILFLIEAGIMVFLGWRRPMEALDQRIEPKVSMLPWKHALSISCVLVGGVAFLFVLFSRAGLAYADGVVSPWFWPLVALIAGVTALLAIFSYRRWNEKYTNYLLQYKPETKDSPQAHMEPKNKM